MQVQVWHGVGIMRQAHKQKTSTALMGLSWQPALLPAVRQLPPRLQAPLHTPERIKGRVALATAMRTRCTATSRCCAEVGAVGR